MKKCNCYNCEAEKDNLSPMEFVYKDSPIHIKYIKKYPGLRGYHYDFLVKHDKFGIDHDYSEMIKIWRTKIEAGIG